MKLTTRIAAAFSGSKPALNPDKHLFMRDPMPGVKSYAWFGRVFEVKRLSRSEPCPQLKAQVVERTFAFLRAKGQGQFRLAQEDFERVRANSWGVYDVDLSQHFEELADHLCVHLVNPQSRVRPNVEARLRSIVADFTAEQFENKPIDDFVTAWASLVEDCTFSLHGQESLQLNNVREDSVRELLGFKPPVWQSKCSRGESTHWLNRLFGWIHS